MTVTYTVIIDLRFPATMNYAACMVCAFYLVYTVHANTIQLQLWQMDPRDVLRHTHRPPDYHTDRPPMSN